MAENYESSGKTGALIKDKLIEALLTAYSLGDNSVRVVNSKRGWTPNQTKKERAALDKILKSFGLPKLTNEEYRKFADW